MQALREMGQHAETLSLGVATLATRPMGSHRR
jgi:hypothetical protein